MTMLSSTTTTNTQSLLWKWVNFGLGSILIHLSGFWLLQNASFRPVLVELQSDIIPVELVEPLPPTAPANPPVAAIASPAPANPPVAPPRANPEPVPPIAATPSVTPSATPSPAPSPPVVPSSPRPSPVVPPSPPSPPPRPQVSPPPAPSPVVRPSPPAPPVPSPSPVVTPPPPVSPSPAAPSQGLMATILGVQSGNGGRDEPTQLAKPQIQQQSFPALAYPLGNQATVLQVQLLINRQGQPEVQAILQGADSPQMRQFVEALIQDWQFSPALSGGQPVESVLLVSVQITPSGS